MVEKCSWSRHLVIALVFTFDTFTASRHIRRGHLFCIELCLQRRTCTEVWYDSANNSCQVQHASEGGSLQPGDLIHPTGTVWGLRMEAVTDKPNNAIYQFRCAPALHQDVLGIVCQGNNLHPNSEEADDVFVGIQPPTFGPSDATPSEMFKTAIQTASTSPSSRKQNRPSDANKHGTTNVHQAETSPTGDGTVGDTTTLARGGAIATPSPGSVVNTHADMQLQAFRKTESHVDTSSAQAELTPPSVSPRKSSAVPRSHHETDQTTSRDHTTSNAQSCCGDPPEVDNAEMGDGEGQSRNYRCVSGYKSRTNITSACTADCQWTRPSASCLKVCGELSQLYGAEPLPGDNIAGTTRLYKCSEGFFSDQIIETTCLDTGKWTLPSNRYSCTVTCVEPPELENAVLVSKVSSEISYKCKEGFTPTTPILLECLPSGTWTPPTKTCTKVECTKAPRYVLHAVYTTRNSTYQGYRCAKHYQETGPIYSICVDGKWTTPTEKCAVKCGPAPEVDNAILGRTTASRQYYTCKPGSIQRNKLYAMCVGEKWTKPSGSCEMGCTTAPRYVPHTTTTSRNSTYQGYKCAKNYKETGPIYSICVDGKWTTPSEKCKANCGPAPDVQNAIPERTTATRQYYKCKRGFVQTSKLYAMCVGKKWKLSPGSCYLFGGTVEMNAVDDHRVSQPSGLAASRRHKGYLYTHNDYHADPEVYVLDAATSHLVAIIDIQNAVNNDWEDIAVGPCGEDSCIYVGDIGGHEHGVGDVKVANIIYRVKEPNTLTNTKVKADVLRFSGSFDDAYVLLVDLLEALYVVSDEKYDTTLHLLPDNWGGDTVKEAKVLHSISEPNDELHTFWSGDISPDGSRLVLLVKNYIYYWSVGEGGIEKATRRLPGAKSIDIAQPQGATFKHDMSGLYVICEDTDLPMYFVKSARP